MCYLANGYIFPSLYSWPNSIEMTNMERKLDFELNEDIPYATFMVQLWVA